MSQELDTGINMYEFNRMNMGKLPVLKTEEEIEGAKTVIQNYLYENDATFYMMLNYDNRDFTLFNFFGGIINNAKVRLMSDDIIECMVNRGYNIIDINKDEVGTGLEIWVKDIDTEAVFMYILFPYDEGVITY
jgi:hypothetical protein